MKILFFPSDRGGGFGHVSRCLVLAQEAQRRGHTCSFFLSSPRYEKLLARDFLVFLARKSSSLKSLLLAAKARFAKTKESVALFTAFSALDYQVIRDGLTSEEVLQVTLHQYLDAIRIFQPDILIGDTNLLVRVAAQKAGLPVIQVVRYTTHPDTKNIMWWDDTPSAMEPPDVLNLLNPWLQKTGLNFITKVGDLLRGDLYIVPSIPELEPIPQDDKTIYVGQLSLAPKSQDFPDWLKQIGDQSQLIYITVGGGAGQVGNKLFFDTIIEAFTGSDLEVVISTGGKLGKHDFSNVPGNVKVFEWVPGKILIPRAATVVFHGGYATMMECIASGKPTIVVPSQTEQEGNGRRIEQLGCGINLKLSSENPRLVEGIWKYGRFSFFIQTIYNLKARDLQDAVKKILTKTEYSDRAGELQTKIGTYGGVQAALDTIERLWA